MTLREFHEKILDKSADVYLYDVNGARLGVYNSYYRYPESHEKALLPCYGERTVFNYGAKNNFGDVAVVLDTL